MSIDLEKDVENLSVAESSDCGFTFTDVCSSAVSPRDIQNTCCARKECSNKPATSENTPVNLVQTFNTSQKEAVRGVGILDPVAPTIPVSPQGIPVRARFLIKPNEVRELTDPLSEVQKKYPKFPLRDIK